MKANIGIDTGGTFTDAFVKWGDNIAVAKQRTTPEKLSLGVMDALASATKALGISLKELFSDTETLSYSTTVATNLLIERKGSQFGLIITEGFEDLVFIGRGASWSDGKSVSERRNVARAKKPIPLIPRYMTVGVKERIDWAGKIVRPLDEEDVVQKLHYLVDKGAEGFVICLLWSYINPTHEQLIKEIAKREYPESMTMLSSDICPKRNDYARMMTTILDAYLYPALHAELGTLDDDLKAHSYRRSPMVVQNSGGVTDISHTAPVKTFNGGPVAGVIGATHIARQIDYNSVITADMGGTSFDVGTVIGGKQSYYTWTPVIQNWEVNLTMVDVTSIGAGGGSIAWINPVLRNRLEVGPQSAGAIPGPVAYDSGGTEPTVTDADVVLGYIDPNYFFGGQIKLNKEKATIAIREKIAKPLGMDVDQAAMFIKKVVDGNMANLIAKQTLLKGYDPSEFVLFAYGGAGATHCCGYGFLAGVNKLIVFPFSPVFSAYGAGTMDIVHIYEQSRRVRLLSPGPGNYLSNYEAFNEIVQSLKDRAVRDIAEEGFLEKSIIFSLELDMKYGGQVHIHRIVSPKLILNTETDVKEICEKFGREYAEVFSPVVVFPQGGIEVYNFVLRATVLRPKVKLLEYSLKGKTPKSTALKGKREVFWNESKGWHKTPVFDMEQLEAGNEIEGPAIIEAISTNLVLPGGVQVTADKYRNFIIERM